MSDQTEHPRVYIGDEPDRTVPVVAVGGVVMVSQQLLEQSNLTATDLDGKTATFDERMTDELAAAYDPEYVSKYRWPEYVPPVVVPPTRRQLARKWIADRLRSVAWKIAPDDTEDEWEDD